MNKSASIGSTPFPEHVEALLNFIEKEPVMKWLLCRVAQTFKNNWNASTEDTNQTLGDLYSVILTTHEDRLGGSPNVNATMLWEREEWVIGHNYFTEVFTGKLLDIQQIISVAEVTGHEIIEAERMYGTEGAATNQYQMTERTMIAEILSCCDGVRWQYNRYLETL